jgi:hypothetical protein
LRNVFRNFKAEDTASTLVTKGLVAARICEYYKPLTDWPSHVIEEVTYRIVTLYCPQHTLTLSVTRCIEGTGFVENPSKVELFQSTLITYENTYGVGISGDREGTLYVRAVAAARDQGRGGRGNGPPGGLGGGRG